MDTAVIGIHFSLYLTGIILCATGESSCFLEYSTVTSLLRISFPAAQSSAEAVNLMGRVPSLMVIVFSATFTSVRIPVADVS